MKIYWIILLLFLLACINIYGSQLKMKENFGEDFLFYPRKIICYENEIFVLDEGGGLSQGHQKIKIFSAEGEFLKEIGRQGEGPGEFGLFIKSFYIQDKKIYVFDEMKRTVHIFSSDSKEYLGLKKFSFPEVYSSVMDFIVFKDGSLYYTWGRSIRDEKLIVKFDPEMKKVGSFLECFPRYENMRELYESSKRKDTPQDTRNGYKNLGYLASSADKIYYAYWILNTVYEFSLDGEMLHKYTLPFESIDKTVNIVKFGKYPGLENKLNYDLKFQGNRLFVLSRDKKGDSVIFELNDGKFKEKYRIKEQLFGFDIMANTLYGIEREEAKIYCYVDL